MQAAHCCIEYLLLLQVHLQWQTLKSSAGDIGKQKGSFQQVKCDWILFLIVPSSLEIFCDTGGGREIKMEGEKENIGKPDPSKRPRPITPKIFKKCKSATFTLDGTSYTIGKSLYRCDWSERREFPFVGSLIPRSGVYQQRESHFVNHHLSGSFTRIICDRWKNNLSQIVW